MNRYLILFLFFSSTLTNAATYGPYSIGRDKTWLTLDLEKKVNLNGFTNALVQEMAKTEKLPMEIIDLSWPILFQALENNEVAGIFHATTPTEILQDKFDQSDPILLLGPVLVVRTNSKATSLGDLKGKIVGIDQFDQSVRIVQQNPSIIIEPYQNMPKALDDLIQGKVDAVLWGSVEANSLVPTYFKDQLKIASQPLNDYAIRLLTLKNKYPNFLSSFNHALHELRNSGRYEELKKEFGL